MNNHRRPMPGGPTANPEAAGSPYEGDPEGAARTIVLRRLEAAPRTRAELRSDLLRRGIPEPVADRVLDRFEAVGLIDDAEFARLWVASRQRTRGSARPVLRQELRRRGIDDEQVSAALEDIDDEQERARGLALASVRIRSMQRFEPEVRKRRLVSMLMRRGYRQGVAFSVVAEAMSIDAGDEFGPGDDPL